MQSRTQLLTPSALRLDSRLPLELRSLDFQILPSPPAPSASSSSHSPTYPPAKADGYASASHGLTTVSSSVFGPREPQRTGPWSSTGTGQGGGGSVGQAAGGQQRGDRGSVNVEVGVAGWGERVAQGGSSEGGLRRGGKDRRTIELAAAVKNTFEPVLLLHLYPRSSIDIYLQILENDGSVLQAAINATSLALISAGLPLSDYVCSLSLASYPSIPPLGPPQIPPFDLVTPAAQHTNSNDPTRTGGSGSTTILDLLAAEETALPNLTIAVLPRSGKVSLINLETRLGVNRFEELLKWGVEGSKVVQAAMQEAVESWAASLAAPRGALRSLCPGVASKGVDEEDEDMV
ncbi:exosome complex component RRP41 [Rhodotorula toruloides]|uniref:Exosome complex component RRP41 n=1 Tax=Rhodotorula toruloides TaxID=5286 RepID=A0A511KME7_RHOTO|nr:exosome complex component RRP41 [Rhodotorula toruloides]